MAQSSNVTQQRKKDAYEFALLLYDIYKEEQADKSVDDDQNNNVYTDEEKSCQELNARSHSVESPR